MISIPDAIKWPADKPRGIAGQGETCYSSELERDENRSKIIPRDGDFDGKAVLMLRCMLSPYVVDVVDRHNTVTTTRRFSALLRLAALSRSEPDLFPRL